MPTLNWIGKEAVVKHHKDVPFRLLEPVAELSCGDNHGKDSGNLIVQGEKPSRAQGSAATLCRAGKMHIYRPALQHRQRALDVQR